jgi:hypothetical protein
LITSEILVKDIWAVGSSIIQRAGEHSKIRPTGTFLGLQQLGCQLVWVGMPGMRWENVVPLIHSLMMSYNISAYF